jgi:tetratricopeptide (TPR) repeat protein
MAVSTAPLSPLYLESAERVRRLHELIHLGEGDGENADEIRDELDDLWSRLTPEDAGRIRGLSVDLNSLGMTRDVPESHGSTEEFNALFIPAQRAYDWDRVLDLLRTALSQFPDYSLAFLRGVFWGRLGDFETALVFFEEALRLNPEHSDSAIAILQTLAITLGRIDEAVDRILELAENHQGLLPQLMVDHAVTAREARQRVRETQAALAQSRKALRDAIREACTGGKGFSTGDPLSPDSTFIFAA